MKNLETILAELKKNKFDPTNKKTKIDESRGVYIICLRENVEFPPTKCPLSIEFETFAGYKVLYVGQSDNLESRVDTHFNDKKTKSSTFRKSLGVLFGYTLVPQTISFTEADEKKLTRWMEDHLIIYFFVEERDKEVKNILIEHFNPPLNLQKNYNSKNKKFRKHLSLLRQNKNK
jgi:predicted GIY-YIG superfamily endonuclease